MNRLAGSLVAGLSLLTFLALLLVFVLPVLLDSSAIKGKIAQIFQERTGRSLVIDGDLKFSFFPEASVNFGHAHVDNPEGFSQQTMATFQGATAVVRGIGLLLGHLDVVELSIDNLEVTLERRQDGVTNWPDLPNRLIDATVWRQPMERAAVSWPEDWLAVQMGLSGLAAVSTGGIQLQGARINWRDRQKDQQYSLENVSVVSRSVGRGATGLELNGNWKWHPARMSGRVSLDFETTNSGDGLELNDIHLFLSSQSGQELLRESECRVTADMVLDPAGRRILLNEMEVGLTGWFTRYSLRDFELVVKGVAEWDLDKAAGKMSDARLAFKAHSDDLPPAGVNFSVRSGLDWQGRTGVLTLSGVHAEGPANTRLQGDFVLQGMEAGLDHLSVAGQLVTEPFDPKALFVAMGQQLPRIMEARDLSRSVLSATFKADAGGVRAESFQLDLDATRVAGNFSWRVLDLPEIRFEVSLDQVDLDRYWDWFAGAEELPGNKPLVAMLVPELSLAGLLSRVPVNLDLEGSLSGRRMQVSGATLENFQMAVKAGDGLLTVDPFQFTLYQGEWKQKIQVDHRGGDSRLLVEKDIKGIQIQPFFTTVAAVDWLSGTMDLSGQVETSGQDFVTARRNLKGSYWLGVKNGALHGVDLTESIRQIAAAVDGRSVSVVAEDQAKAKTAISELTATARVGQGRLINSDLLAVSNSSVIKGKGEADLVEMTVDYTFSADAQAALKGMDIPYWDRLEGAVLPIHVVGPLRLLKKPNIGEPQLTRHIIAAKQSQQGGDNFQGRPPPFAEAPSFVPMADAFQRSHRPAARWKRGLFSNY